MEKKYKLTDETMEYFGRTLRRIEAVRPFNGIMAGEKGGWVESEDNLSHKGNCWIYNDAKALNDARVYGDAVMYNSSTICRSAQLHGEARVYDKSILWDCADVSGNAVIYGNVEIYGYAKVYGSCYISGNAAIYNNAKISGSAKIYGDADIHNNAKVYGYALVYGNVTLMDNVEVYGSTEIYGSITVRGNSKIGSSCDYIIFKNNFSSYRYFIYTKSNKKWSVGCFYGTGKQLIEKAKKDSAEKARQYALYVDLVKNLEQ